MASNDLDELEKLQLELALAQSLQDVLSSHTQATKQNDSSRKNFEFTNQEEAFFTDTVIGKPINGSTVKSSPVTVRSSPLASMNNRALDSSPVRTSGIRAAVAVSPQHSPSKSATYARPLPADKLNVTSQGTKIRKENGIIANNAQPITATEMAGSGKGTSAVSTGAGLESFTNSMRSLFSTTFSSKQSKQSNNSVRQGSKQGLGRICGGCNTVIDNGTYITTHCNDNFHQRCFKCNRCHSHLGTSYSHSSSPSAYYHKECYNDMQKENAISSGRVCKNCGNAIFMQSYKVLPDGNIFHTDCFRCCACREVIDGPFVQKGEPPLPYHQQCAVELFNPRCCVCCATLMGSYLSHPFFESERYCREHKDARPSCFACGRLEPLPSSSRESFTVLSDGRSLCSDCTGTIIIDSSEANDIYKSVITFLGNELALPIPDEMWDVPVHVVDIDSINENIRRSDAGILGHHTPENVNPTDSSTALTGSSGPIVRGVTLSRCREIRHIPSGTLNLSNIAQGLLAGSMPTITYQTKQIRDVSAVLVLYGLPKDLIASIIAHESMHVWLKLNARFPFQLPSKVEEGLCQVVAYKYLDYINSQRYDQPSSNVSSSNGKTNVSGALSEKEFGQLQQEESLRAYFHHQIETDQSPIYGDGFREAIAAVSALGLNELLEYVAQSKSFPTI